MNRSDQMKAQLLRWFRTYADGFKNAKTKTVALQCIRIEERTFRQLMSDLKKEGFVSSTSDMGYWSNPESPDYDELQAQKHSVLEMRSRAMAMLEGSNIRLKQIEDKIASMTYQPNLL